ncbi:MAG: hypothetical protein FWG71_09935, partial [Synergistaceae bacterium]|nr:hypothetical protein [Synergistaceae bacterium]
MNDLRVVTTGYFDTSVECDFYSDGDDVYMTINQLARALGYADRNGVDQIISRNPYLSDPEFSVYDRLSGNDGKKYKTRLFTEDG